MTKKVIFYADEETRSKLDNLAEGSDMSKVIRGLILREWDDKHNSIRVPVAGKLNNHTTIDDFNNLQISGPYGFRKDEEFPGIGEIEQIQEGLE